MLFHIIYLFLFSIYEVISYDLSGSTWTDIHGNKIDLNSYCKNKNCIAKCCPINQIMLPKGGPVIPCYEKQPKNTIINKLTHYSYVNVYKRDEKSKRLLNSTNLESHFVFVRNNMLSDGSKTKWRLFNDCETVIMEDGSLVSSSPNDMCDNVEKLEYCVEYVMQQKPKANNETKGKLFATMGYWILTDEDPDGHKKHAFKASGMLISSFCMLLVLLVYSLLPNLQNIVGKILMAYLFSLIVTFVTKAVQLIIFRNIGDKECRIISAILYFFLLSSFFWSNIMSFDLWWTIRGSRKNRAIHRQGELIKFLWYCLSSFGTSLLITFAALSIDLYATSVDIYHKPPFKSCFAGAKPILLYVQIPIAVLTGINFILFLMTAYNIWLVKRAVSNTSDSRNTKSSENRFVIYIKLSVLMGVSWLLEIVPDMTIVPYVFVNFFNMFIGVAIFYILVCKKSIIIQLCKRFNIGKNLVTRLESSRFSKRNTQSSTISAKSRRSRRRSSDEGATLTRIDTKIEMA
ncbi:G-protein coupled receptor Mth2-like [Anticarsia gemmatalis]|uniref:G-protein coupled receptor Mth2-like n=1 Tax=Anticarsia gemmatalis TaxID=129554 RepID=UPI003F75B004